MDRNRMLYTPEGNPGVLRVLPYAAQQILAMFVTNLVPVTLITGAAYPALTQEEILRLMQSAMVAAGMATFIQATPIWKIGSGLPIFMGVSFTFVVPLSAIAAKSGYGAVIGAVLVGGVFEGILGYTAPYWRRVISPVVSGLVVMGIGLSLFSTAARSFGGGYVEDFGSLRHILTGSVTVVACLLWMIFVRGQMRHLALLAGMAVGYLVALLFGLVDFSGFSGSWFALPELLPYKPVFRLDGIISIAIVYLVSATETMGDASAVTEGVLQRELTPEETRGVLMVDGLGSVLSGLFGGTPITSYSENVGLTIITGIINRNVARVGGVLMILAGLFPPVGRFFSTVPKPVIGGMLLMVLGQILVSGIEILSKAGFSERNRLITAITMAVAIGFTTSTEAGIWSSFPVAVQTIFSQNEVAVIFVLAFVLNLILPQSMENTKQK